MLYFDIFFGFQSWTRVYSIVHTHTSAERSNTYVVRAA